MLISCPPANLTSISPAADCIVIETPFTESLLPALGDASVNVPGPVRSDPIEMVVVDVGIGLITTACTGWLLIVTAMFPDWPCIETGSGFGAATFNVFVEIIGNAPDADTESGFGAATFNVDVEITGSAPLKLTGNGVMALTVTVVVSAVARGAGADTFKVWVEMIGKTPDGDTGNGLGAATFNVAVEII